MSCYSTCSSINEYQEGKRSKDSVGAIIDWYSNNQHIVTKRTGNHSQMPSLKSSVPIASNTAFMAYGRKDMEITEHAIHILAEMEASVEVHYRDFTDLAHGFEHVQRVYHLALSLSDQEQADGCIVGMAALLHDLGRITRGPTRSHAARSAKLDKQLLVAYDLPSETLYTIQHAILAHGYRHGSRPATPEACVLYDADRWRCALEQLG
jgi:hypothetical protein